MMTQGSRWPNRFSSSDFSAYSSIVCVCAYSVDVVNELWLLVVIVVVVVVVCYSWYFYTASFLLWRNFGVPSSLEIRD